LRAEQEGEEPRLQMLMTVREFGLDCLREYGELEQAQLAHAAYFLSFAEEAEPNLKSTGQLTWLTQLEMEQDNLRAALERLIASREAELALRLCGALRPFWFRRGYWSEGRGWLRAALDLPAEYVQLATRAKALYAAGELVSYQDDDAEARLLLEESVALYRQLGDEDDLIAALSVLGLVLQNQGDLAASYALEEESITLARKLNNTWELASTLFRCGHTVWLQNDPTQAILLTEESLAIARGLDDMSLTARILNDLAYMFWQRKNLARAAMLTKENLLLARELDDKYLLNSTLETLGVITLDQGHLAQAKTYFIESIALAKSLGRTGYLSYCLSLLARVAAAQGQFQHAARLYGAAETGGEMDTILNESERAEYQRNVAVVHAQLGEVAFATAWAEGQALTVEQSLATLEDETRSEPVPAVRQLPPVILAPVKSLYPDDLTPREVEVLRLLARGWTDAQIAEYLVISRRTVNKHTTSIYSKIAVTSRSAATRYAIEKKLA